MIQDFGKGQVATYPTAKQDVEHDGMQRCKGEDKKKDKPRHLDAINKTQ